MNDQDRIIRVVAEEGNGLLHRISKIFQAIVILRNIIFIITT